MRNYIILLLLWSVFGNAQYNLFARQNFAKSGSFAPTFNTYIGGVSGTITSASSLSTKLGISVGAISNFTVVGSNIKCKITGSYAIPATAFQFNTTPCTYYIDSDYLVTSLGGSVFYSTSFAGICDFQNATSIGAQALSSVLSTKFLLKNATSIGDSGFLNSNISSVFYIPNVTSLGATSGNNSVFAGIKSGAKIYANPSLATNNGGSPDGDLTEAIALGATVAYVTNYTAPNPVTTLASGTVYNTAIQLNFTPPSSTNTIDYYECYANGVLKNNITASGGYIIGLTASTSYNITVIAVDIFYNKSAVSNTLTQSTNTTSAQPTTGLVSYYKLDETSAGNAIDSFGSTNLINTGITINQTGKIGQSYLSSAVSQYLNSTTFTPITTNISFNLWVYRTATGAGTYPQLIGTGSYATNAGMSVFITPSGDLGWIINQDYNNWSSLSNIPLNTWKMVTVVYNGANVKTYINAVLLRTDTKTGAMNSTSLFRMYSRQENDGTFIGKIDETAIYNVALTQTQIDLIYNAGNGTTL